MVFDVKDHITNGDLIYDISTAFITNQQNIYRQNLLLSNPI